MRWFLIVAAALLCCVPEVEAGGRRRNADVQVFVNQAGNGHCNGGVNLQSARRRNRNADVQIFVGGSRSRSFFRR